MFLPSTLAQLLLDLQGGRQFSEKVHSSTNDISKESNEFPIKAQNSRQTVSNNWAEVT